MCTTSRLALIYRVAANLLLLKDHVSCIGHHGQASNAQRSLVSEIILGLSPLYGSMLSNPESPQVSSLLNGRYSTCQRGVQHAGKANLFQSAWLSAALLNKHVVAA
jgi:hypothetical protein